MERTKYTPKRLLSLLLALVMLLGMLPTTTALAAEPVGGIIANSDEYTKDGLVIKFEPVAPEGPFFLSDSKTFQIHYTISIATGDQYRDISKLNAFKRLSLQDPVGNIYQDISGSTVTANATDGAFSGNTHVVDNDGTNVYVFNAGTVIAEGNFDGYNYVANDDVHNNGTGKLLQKIYFVATWYGLDETTNIYTTSHDEEGVQHSEVVSSVALMNLPLGYSVTYNNGGYTGVAASPKGRSARAVREQTIRASRFLM